MEIPLQVTVPAAGTYTITMPESDSNTAVYIKDTNNSYHDLTNAYSLTATTSETLNYTLVFGQTTRVQTDSSIGITLTQNKTSVTINTSGSATLQRVYVYSETGQLVNALENSGNEVQFNLPSANGIYLVKITTSLGSVTKKLINR
jgi:L-fucose isomerase-like protein